MRYAAYLCGLAAIVVAYVALLRSTTAHSVVFYTALVLLEVAAIVLVLAMEYAASARCRVQQADSAPLRTGERSVIERRITERTDAAG